MINLLPDAKKASLRSARANTILGRYIIVLIGALLFIGGVIFVSYNSLELSEKSALSQLGSGTSQAADATRDAKISATIQSTTSASQVLNTVSSALPSGIVMKSIAVQPQQSTEPIVMTLYGKVGTQASELSQQLETTGVFSDVKITSTQNNSKERPGYPVKIDLSAHITQGQTMNPMERMAP